jgi:hypothetical protein
MALKVFNSEAIKDLAVEKFTKNEKEKAYVPYFIGNASSNLSGGKDSVRMIEVSPETKNLSYYDLKNRIENSAESPSSADIQAFYGKTYFDLQRYNAEAGDLTSLIANEITDYNMEKTPSVRDYEPDRGVMADYAGTNDPVPLIQQNTGNLDTFTVGIKALGWKDCLLNQLYNRWFSMDKVIKAASDAYTDAKNAAGAGMIVGTTYAASQKQAAATTSGSTLDELTYETFVKGIKVLRGLKDIYTKRPIAVTSISVLCNSADTWQISNVIRGQLLQNGGGARGNVSPGLPIGNIIEYDRGINDGFTIGKVEASFPGVTAGKCYLFVPGVMMIGNKRPLTTETGNGSVLELSTEERAWYAVFGGFYKQFLGTSFVGSSCGAGYGYIVEVTLPA